MIAALVANTIFVDGRFEAAASGETLPLIDPATGRTTGAISAGGAAEVDRAVRSATAALEGGLGTARRRGSRSAAGPLRHDDRAARGAARAARVARYRQADLACGRRRQAHGETIPYVPGCAVQVLRVPVGVTGHIIPWNYPAHMFARSRGIRVST